MSGGGEQANNSAGSALDRIFRSPLYVIGGIVSGTIVTTGSNVLSQIILYWIEKTPIYSQPTPDSGTGAATPTPVTTTPVTNVSDNGTVLAAYEIGNTPIPLSLIIVTILAAIVMGILLSRLFFHTVGGPIQSPFRFGGLLMGAITGSIAGLGIGWILVPTAVYGVAIPFGILGATIGDIITE